MPEFDPTRTLARFALETRFEDLDEDLVRHVKRSMLDCIGVALGGLDHPSTEILLEHLRELGGVDQASVWGRGERLNVAQAALVNGYMAHVLDYDDTFLPPDALLHVNATLLPAALAAAEWKVLPGRELITAFAVGFETEARIARAAGRTVLERGWHSSGVCGTFGSAVAAGRLVGLNESQLCHALGVAGSQTSGSTDVLGSHTKAFQPGSAAQKGLVAALLAGRGFTSSERFLESRRGCFLGLFSEAPAVERLTDGLGEDWELRRAAFKAFACGIVAQPLMDGVVRLRNEHALRPEMVASIEGRVHPFVLVPMGRREPRTGLEGKFSAFYGAAICLVDGTAGKPQFTDERVNDPVVVRLRQRVKIETDPSVAPHEAFVTIRLTDGRKLGVHVEHGKGTSLNPLTDQELRGKFEALAIPAVGSECAAAVLETIGRLELVADAGELARATVPQFVLSAES